MTMVEKTPAPEELKSQRLRELFEGDIWSLPPELWLGGEIAEEIEKRLLALGWSDDQIGFFSLAVHEAFVNAVKYGSFGIRVEEGPNKKEIREKKAMEIEASGEFKDKLVSIVLDLSPREATVRITDQGQGFSVDAIPDPTDPSRLLELTGRGIDIMKKSCDRAEFKDNTVTLYKKRVH